MDSGKPHPHLMGLQQIPPTSHPTHGHSKAQLLHLETNLPEAAWSLLQSCLFLLDTASLCAPGRPPTPPPDTQPPGCTSFLSPSASQAFSGFRSSRLVPWPGSRQLPGLVAWRKGGRCPLYCPPPPLSPRESSHLTCHPWHPHVGERARSTEGLGDLSRSRGGEGGGVGRERVGQCSPQPQRGLNH